MPTEAARLPRWLVGLCVAGLTALGLALRWSGIDSVLPHDPEPDPYVLLQTERLRSGLDDELPDPSRGKYPWLLAELNALVPGGDLVAAPADAGLAEHLAAASAPHVKARALFAVLSLLAIPATFLLARRFLDAPASLLAAALVATSLMHTSLSTQVRPHGPVTTFSLVALLAAVRAVERESLWSFAAAGLCAGVALGTLHNGVFALPPLVVAAVLVARRRGLRSACRGALALALAAAIGWWSYAPRFDAPAEGASSAEAEAEADPPSASPKEDVAFALGHHVHLNRFNGLGLLRFARTVWSHDPALGVLALVGAGSALAAARRAAGVAPRLRDAAWLAAAFAAPTLIVFGAYQASMPRYFLPLWPLLAILAAAGVSMLHTKLLARVRMPWSLVALAALAFPTAVALKLAWLRARPDTAALAARWIDANVERRDAKVFLGALRSLPLFQRPETARPDALWSRTIWERYQMQVRPRSAQKLGFDLRYLSYAEQGKVLRSEQGAAEIASMLASCDYGVSVVPSPRPPSRPGTARRVEELYSAAFAATPTALRASFEAYPEGAESDEIAHDLATRAAIDVLRARRTGPELEIREVLR